MSTTASSAARAAAARVSHRPALSCRRAGAGPLVVALHSSTGSQGQWRALAERLDGRAELIAPDLYGHGRSPAWPALPTAGRASLDIDALAVGALAQACRPDVAEHGLHLVGHSYGAAVAVRLALRHPQRVRSLTLYEPVLFGLLDGAGADGPTDTAEPALDEIREIARSVASLVRAGELVAAAQVFVAYWGGAAAWRALDASQQAAVVHRIGTVPRHFEALFAATWRQRLLQRLTMPVWLMHGSATRPSARRATEALAARLPAVQRVELAGAGHLGPITHANAVADAMAGVLGQALADSGTPSPRLTPALTA